MKVGFTLNTLCQCCLVLFLLMDYSSVQGEERFVIIASTLARDFLPSSWSYYTPTWVEIGLFIGTLGLFFTCYLIFVRLAPVIAVAEVKHILKSGGDQYVGENAVHNDSAH